MKSFIVPLFIMLLIPVYASADDPMDALVNSCFKVSVCLDVQTPVSLDIRRYTDSD